MVLARTGAGPPNTLHNADRGSRAAVAHSRLHSPVVFSDIYPIIFILVLFSVCVLVELL